MPSSDKKNLVIAFLACTTLAGAGLLVHTRQQLADARNAPTLQVTRTEVKTAAAPAPIVATPIATPALADETPNLDNTPNDRPEGGPSQWGGRGNRGGGAQMAAQMAELMKDPEFAAAWKLEQTARIEQRYGALFQDLKLPPDQQAKLTALLVERENAGRDVFLSAREQGLDPRDPAAREQLRTLTADLQAEVDANIEASVGASVVTALDQYNATGAQRNTVNTINQSLTYGGQPLNSAQSKQLTTILAATGTQAGRNTLITDATLTQAAGVLTNAQLTALKKVKAQQEAEQLVQTKMREARDAARAARDANNQNRN
ncbi:MAG: hypothetical protein H7067_12795 [Burkholderiales bacterium]|nr:hypothetical protein [Opitutaceae bacterium]